MKPAGIVIAAPIAAPVRCFCPECIRLDREHPGEGFQLALFGPIEFTPRSLARGVRLTASRGD